MRLTFKTVFALVVANVLSLPNILQASDKGPEMELQTVKDTIDKMIRSPNGLYWEARYNPRVAKLPAEPIAHVFREKMEAVNKNEKVPEKELTALLLIMRRNPSKLFVAELKKAMEFPTLSSSLKVEALLTLGDLEGTSDYLKAILKTADDRMRAAAIDALCVRGGSEEIRSVLQQFIKKDVDYTATYTGNALSRAKSLLDTISAYNKLHTNGDRLQFLVNSIPYKHPRTGGGLPYLPFDGYANFLMSECRKLALEDPKSAKDALERRAKEKDPGAWTVPLLLRDLDLEPKKESAMMTKGVEKNGVKLEVSMPSDSVAGTEILCKVSLTNNSSEVFDYDHKRQSNYRQFGVLVRNADGEVVPYTAFGNFALGGVEKAPGSSVIKQFAKGNVLSQQYNLSRLFDLSMSGKYTISVKRDFNDGKQKKDKFSIELSEMEFEILEPAN